MKISLTAMHRRMEGSQTKTFPNKAIEYLDIFDGHDATGYFVACIKFIGQDFPDKYLLLQEVKSPTKMTIPDFELSRRINVERIGGRFANEDQVLRRLKHLLLKKRTGEMAIAA